MTYDKATWKVNQTDLEGRKEAISNVTLLRAAADQLLELVKIETKLLPSKNASRIWIGGVGQGSMLSLSAFLRYVGDDRLGGVVGLLGYVPLPVGMMETSTNSTLQQSRTPLLLYNGVTDHLCPAIFVRDTYLHFDSVYEERKYNLEQHMQLGLGHDTSPEMLAAAKRFFTTTMSTDPNAAHDKELADKEAKEKEKKTP